MAKKRITKAEQISKYSPEKISKLGGDEGIKILRGYVRTLRSSYKRRVGSFRRKGLVSHAQISLEREIPKTAQLKLTKMNRNQLLLEFFRYAAFFNAETSSEEGIKKVNREQDIRIFGSKSNGKPRYTMTNEERTLFWDVYDEYKNIFPADVNHVYSSESVQQQLADALFNGGAVPTTNLVAFLSSVKDSLHQEKTMEDMSDVPNVFSGRRPDF